MNIKYYDICKCCNFKALDKSKWEKHINCKKHKRNGRSKYEDYQCKICNYWTLQLRNFMIHKIVHHGTTEEKKSAPKYCECCNKAFFCDLFYSKHIESLKHELTLKRHKLIQNNKFNDIDQLLNDHYYMQYLDDIEKQIKKSLKILKLKSSLSKYQFHI
jgi:hypothetical protein